MTKFNLQPTGPIALTATVTVGAPDVSRRYINLAFQLASAIHPIAAAPSSTIPMLFVAAQAAETALKAYLLKSVPLQTLKDSKQRHDIAALWMWSRAKGLALTPVLPSGIAQLARLHGEPYPLRYADDEVARLTFSPDANLLQAEVEALLQLVSNSL